MSEQSTERGAAEENTGVSETAGAQRAGVPVVDARW